MIFASQILGQVLRTELSAAPLADFNIPMASCQGIAATKFEACMPSNDIE